MGVDAFTALKELKLAYYRGKYTMPDVELQAIVKTSPYKDKTSGGLTTCITDFVKYSGGKASRVNTTGTYDRNKRKFIKSGSTKGASDIDVVYQGRAIKIEVKIARDTQSTKQKEWQADIEAAGGIYYIARSFQSFYDWWVLNIKKG